MDTQTQARMPAAFFGHGSPMNALETNRYTEAWRAFGEGIPRPRAILVVSAHWYVNATAVTAMARPRTIQDFYGFPRQLFQVEAPRLQGHGDFSRAVPTPDHFIPLLYFAALADAAAEPAKILIDGYAMGSISMTCYTLDCRCAAAEDDLRPAAPIPDPAIVPAEDSNV
jgi:aromatic ring-opening dioxygenase catalytic subunit (LigB family)